MLVAYGICPIMAIDIKILARGLGAARPMSPMFYAKELPTMAKGDNRAVVGSSGKVREGMVLRSGTPQVRDALGRYTIDNPPKFKGGVQFDLSRAKDESIGGKAPDGSEGGKVLFPGSG